MENIGNGGRAVAGQHSTTAPIGRQNNGTESVNVNSVWSSRGYLLIISTKKVKIARSQPQT